MDHATVITTVALRQLRQQGNVIEDEVKRNRARDELLDGQLRELSDREHARAREQAEQVDLVWTVRSVSASYGQVVNDSRRPIRDVTCQIERADGSLAMPDKAGELTLVHIQTRDISLYGR